MKAIVLESYGPNSSFKAVDTPIAPPPANYLQVAIAATSVNPIDCKVRAGLVPAINPATPAILHGDIAGTVTAVGEGVSGFAIGDCVYGCAAGFKGLGGALAERVNVPAALMALAPKSIPIEDCAALPLVAITAWQALFDKARIQPGQKVLVHGGCGGVGHMALQLAKIAGAEVSTTVSSEAKAEIARQLGADHIIFYQQESVAEYLERITGGAGFDVVVDTVGSDNMDRSFQAVCTHGNVVTIAARSTHDLTPLHSKGASLHVVFMLTPLITGEGMAGHGAILKRVQGFIDLGKLKPLIDRQRFSMTANQVAEAHAYLASGKAMGKILITGMD